MYKIEKKDYGYKLTFGDFMKEDEMRKWVEDSKKELQSAGGSFGVLIDMRTLKPLPPESQKVMEEGQKLFKTKGMARSAVIISSATTKLQFVRLAKESGIYQWERYIDEQSHANWEKLGIDWIKDQKDPDK